MKTKNNSLICISILLLMTTVAKAENSAGGLFIEPAVTYESDSTSTNYPTPLSSSSGLVDGFGLGARAGIHFYEAFFVGADLRYSMPQFHDSSVNYNAKAIAINWGPVVGMQMPSFGVRLWGTYIMGGDFNPEASSGLDVKFIDASGYRVGAGFRLSTLSLNLEYQILKYASTRLEQLGPFTTGSTLDGVQHETKSWIASVSFPLEI